MVNLPYAAEDNGPITNVKLTGTTVSYVWQHQRVAYHLHDVGDPGIDPVQWPTMPNPVGFTPS